MHPRCPVLAGRTRCGATSECGTDAGDALRRSRLGTGLEPLEAALWHLASRDNSPKVALASAGPVGRPALGARDGHDAGPHYLPLAQVVVNRGAMVATGPAGRRTATRCFAFHFVVHALAGAAATEAGAGAASAAGASKVVAANVAAAAAAVISRFTPAQLVAVGVEARAPTDDHSLGFDRLGRQRTVCQRARRNPGKRHALNIVQRGAYKKGPAAAEVAERGPGGVSCWRSASPGVGGEKPGTSPARLPASCGGGAARRTCRRRRGTSPAAA
ncbi:hypothetical protein SROCM77S_00506 [Streptomyces rochei]